MMNIQNILYLAIMLLSMSNSFAQIIKDSVSMYYATDHPQYPEDYILHQAFISSSERSVIISGTAKVFNNKTSLYIKVPPYYESFTTNHEYFLTSVGAYAGLFVKSKMENEKFQIGIHYFTPLDSLEIHWMIIGERNDAYAKQYPFQYEVEKKHKGTYIENNVYQFHDIIETSKEWRAEALEISKAFAKEAGISKHVVDYGISGSFAYGYARGSNNPDPSDIDFIITLNFFYKDKFNKTELKKITDLKEKYKEIYKSDLETELNIDIVLSESSYLTLNDPDFIYYSLLEDKLYGRDDGLPKYVKLVFHNGNWYPFDKGEWNKYKRKYDLKAAEIKEVGEQIILIDRVTGNEIISSIK